ncbi:Tetraacyldisaccharide 4'-kinase [Arenibacter antarcticus]|uniref:Tetraacyldisaccharide 4'-kinase n=1 Tax=Arenibacter antarcticus TaxID=2040469 RepID=A0ABW5VJ35_9FLAO|nr:tetraacyldisaccharide 4'-kinase [Arenibacter sp. H213]MCM4169640.1 tetraacyldisaccharide 4'-kinase [Arenibacter sp. H213]
MQLLRKLVFPLSLIYAFIVYLRNFLYDHKILGGKSFATKTICVGNLSVGGTGKTPMIEFLISNLMDSKKIAVLSRGYGRKSKGFILAGPQVKVEELGDEPYQISTKFPKISVAVDVDRQHGIVALENAVAPDVILLDDAFQHRKVRCEHYILLTAYGQLYVDDWYLPTGNLRDSKGEAKRANIIVVTKCPRNISDAEQKDICVKLKPKSRQKVLFSYLEYDTALKGGPMQLTLEELKNKKITLVTGIADPSPLVNYLLESGLELEHLSYSDHHFFSKKEIDIFSKKELILTTEKDFVRLSGKIEQLYFVGIKHVFLGNGKEVLMGDLV